MSTLQVDKQDQPEAGKSTASPMKIMIWVAILAFVALMGWGLINSSATRPEAGQTAPAFTMEYFNGYEWETRTVADLDEMQGKVVVVNFWASWCVECRVEAHEFEQAWQKYKDQDVVFVGIAYADVEPNSIAYMKEFGLTYPHAPDLGTAISADYEITGVPETFIIGKDGVIADVVIGPVRPGYLDRVINPLLTD
ncbi:MAG: TlpA family protein disulfide reductase [Chloroflexi bacterium]|nr:MAG: TlpA family protein disulfide reductase [Chloroflexota bacterium]